MRSHNNDKDLLIRDTDKEKHEITKYEQDLWGLSARAITKMRNQCIISKKSGLITVLQSLELNKQNKSYANQYKVDNTNSIQIRIEDDWVAYSKAKQNEICENEVPFFLKKKDLNFHTRDQIMLKQARFVSKRKM